jgi:uncharacterized protein
MASLLEQIKSDINLSRKKSKKVRISILSTLYGEAVSIGKNDGNRESTDTEVSKLITKFIKNNNESLAILKKNIPKLKFENKLLSRYLPKQLSEGELVAAISCIIGDLGASSPKDMGKVMKELKAQHGGLYDGKSASQIVKEQLQ